MDDRPAAPVVLLVALVVAEIAWIATRDSLHGTIRWLPLPIVIVLHVGLFVAERRRPVLGVGTIVAASGAVIAVAVAVTPYGSNDVYLYSIYGRMITKYHLNPFVVTPRAVAPDPLLARVEPDWLDAPSSYGPIFTAVAAAGSLLYGTSALAARLFFQSVAGLSLLGATSYLHRRGQPSSTLVAIGLSPVLVAAVNGGHNDVLTGLLALIGLDLVVRGREVLGSAVIAIGCAVKLLVLPVAGAVVVALALARRWGAAARAAAVVVGLLAISYLVVGGLSVADAPLRGTQTTISRLSPWRLAPDPAELIRSGHVSSVVALSSLAAASVLIWRLRSRPDAVTMATAFAVVISLGAAYIVPWYPAAFLPLAALGTDRVAKFALTLGATVMLVGYVAPPGAFMSSLEYALPVARVVRWVLAALIVWTVVAARGQPTPRRSTTNAKASSSL